MTKLLPALVATGAAALLLGLVWPAAAQDSSTAATNADAAPAEMAAAEAAKPGLYVTDFAWTDGVQGDRSVEQRFTEKAPVGPIFLWTRMVGSQEALEALRQQNRLPIWHQWYVSCGAEVDFDGASRPIDKVDLKIDGGSVLDALQQEVSSREYFDWQTWSMKQNVSACRYTVKIVDNKADPIWCEDIKGNCELSIRLGN